MGPEMDHYWCHRVFIIKTRAAQITDTVRFHSQDYPAPIPFQSDDIMDAASKLTEALELPSSVEKVGQTQLESLKHWINYSKHP